MHVPARYATRLDRRLCCLAILLFCGLALGWGRKPRKTELRGAWLGRAVALAVALALCTGSLARAGVDTRSVLRGVMALQDVGALVWVDGGGGLSAAQEVAYPQVPRQRCWVHKLRNVAGKVRAKHRKQCLRGARRIYKAKSYRAAVRRCRQWAAKWRKLEPKAVACLEEDIEELLVHMRVLRKEPELWKKVRTTNVIERQFRELRKRIRPMCSFANGESCNRIVCALLQKANKRSEQRWASQRRLEARARVNQKAA